MTRRSDAGRAQLLDRLQLAEEKEKLFEEQLSRLERDLEQKSSEIENLSECLAGKTTELEAVSQQLRESKTLFRQGFEHELSGIKEDHEQRVKEVRAELESRIAQMESDYSGRHVEIDKVKTDLSLKFADLEEMKKTSLSEVIRIKESMTAEKEAALSEQRARYKARTEEVRFLSILEYKEMKT